MKLLFITNLSRVDLTFFYYITFYCLYDINIILYGSWDWTRPYKCTRIFKKNNDPCYNCIWYNRGVGYIKCIIDIDEWQDSYEYKICIKFPESKSSIHSYRAYFNDKLNSTTGHSIEIKNDTVYYWVTENMNISSKFIYPGYEKKIIGTYPLCRNVIEKGWLIDGTINIASINKLYRLKHISKEQYNILLTKLHNKIVNSHYRLCKGKLPIAIINHICRMMYKDWKSKLIILG